MRAFVILLAMACAQPEPDGDTPTDDLEFDGPALRETTDGECPDLSASGTVSFSSSGQERDVVVLLPDDVEPGMPAMTVWHGLGDSAQSMAAWMALQDFANDHGMIVLVPDSTDRNGLTWNPLGDADIRLFDDLRTCLSQEHDIDLSRLSATGFSFGGLWTTYLTMNRARTLSTTLVMSGGTSPFVMPYDTPATDLPVLIMWGGENDVYGSGPTGVRFEETSLDFSGRLREDGHFVALCDHGGGHTVPDDIHDLAADWLLSHTLGEPSPFEGDVSSLPSYCGLP